MLEGRSERGHPTCNCQCHPTVVVCTACKLVEFYGGIRKRKVEFTYAELLKDRGGNSEFWWSQSVASGRAQFN